MHKNSPWKPQTNLPTPVSIYPLYRKRRKKENPKEAPSCSSSILPSPPLTHALGHHAPIPIPIPIPNPIPIACPHNSRPAKRALRIRSPTHKRSPLEFPPKKKTISQKKNTFGISQLIPSLYVLFLGKTILREVRYFPYSNDSPLWLCIFENSSQ